MCKKILAMALLLISGGSGMATTIRVPSDFVLIQDAIDASQDGDVVEVWPGTFLESGIAFRGKAVTVRSVAPEDSVIVASTVVDANLQGRVFTFEDGETESSILSGLTVTGGGLSGGGIFVGGASPLIENCVITGNTAYTAGGGIYFAVSDARLQGCTITGNYATKSDAWGGGIYCQNSAPLIAGCVITGNGATYGGGIGILSGSPRISASIIEDNWGMYGGGIYEIGSTSRVERTIISENCAWLGGGGVWCEGDYSSPTFEGCLISGNTATEPWPQGADGGGVFCGGRSTLALTNCTIADNTATDQGGGLA